jgi:hypothetical protein
MFADHGTASSRSGTKFTKRTKNHWFAFVIVVVFVRLREDRRDA